MIQVQFTVWGEPQGKGRPRMGRAGGYTSIYTPKETRAYEERIRAAYLSQFSTFRFPKDAVLDLQVLAYCGIAKSTSNKKRLLMLSHVLRPSKKPDGDNILKAVADALNEVAYDDDKQLVDMQIHKFFAEEPRIEIRLQEVRNE